MEAHPKWELQTYARFIPVSGITMEETVFDPYKVAERIGNEFGMPVFAMRMRLLNQKEETLLTAGRVSMRDS